MKSTGVHKAVAALGGLLAAATALALGYLVADLSGGPWAVDAVGVQVIDWTPGAAKDWAVRELGTFDRTFLRIVIVAVLAVLSMLAGIIGARSGQVGRSAAVTMAGVLGLVGVGFALFSRAATTSYAVRLLPATVTLVVAVVAMYLIVRTFEVARYAGPAPAADVPTGEATTADAAAVDATGPGGATSVTADRSDAPDGFDRRKFLVTASAVGAVGAVGYGATFFVSGGTSEAARAKLGIPRPNSPAPPLPAGVSAGVDGVSSFVTPNKSFYRVDTLLEVPRIDPKTWRLRVHGMVDRELDLSFADLVDRRLIERDITLTCVSNEVGGPYVGNARWIGVPIAEILREAGVRGGADAVKSTSVDGLTIGTPLKALTDGRDAIFAVAMNGEPLPFLHGFPVRMVVPGLYGYVSATKWIVDFEVTRFEDFTAYWTERNWAVEAPIKTSSRIDVPKGFARIKAGPAVAAGVAWAQHRGIRKVEVQVDDGPWQDATLAAEDSIDTWRQWTFRWNATAGNHKLTVRATDGDGQVQTTDRAAPRPNGSSGLHNTVVMVE